MEGQERLRAASVLVVGAGGLGCPAALYLAAAGVGRLTLADGDKVDLTNLQRQVLYHTHNVGARKVDAARDALLHLNPEVEIFPMPARLESATLDKQVRQADVVLDCSDNFATRHAINRACVQHRKPLVSGAAIRFDGQLMVFDLRKKESPCYACLFPEDGEVEEVQCSVMGVFAPLTGIVGALQAAEAIKLISGDAPTEGLLLLDLKTTESRRVQVKKDASCPVCSPRAR